MILSGDFFLKKKLLLVLGLMFLVFGLVIFRLIQQTNKYNYKLPPNTIINQVNVGGLTPAQATEKLNRQVKVPIVIKLEEASGSSLVDAKMVGLNYDFDKITQEQTNLYLRLSPWQKLKLLGERKIKPAKFGVHPLPNEAKLDLFLTQLEQKIGSPSQEASIELGEPNNPNSLIFHQAKPGVSLDKQLSKLSFNPTTSPPTLTLAFKPQPKKLTTKEIANLKLRAKKLVGRSIRLKNTDQDVDQEINDQTLVGFLDPYGTWQEELIEKSVTELAKKINRPPQNAVFEYDSNTLVVTKFQPDKPGLVLNQEKLTADILDSLNEWENQTNPNNQKEVILKFEVKPPEITLKDTNNLGINERIGVGDSLYFHSINSRVHNVGLAASKVNNIILRPGEEFSFNQAVGEVSAKTGYKSAYVIKNGRTEKGDGGGVCQVSTTLFRAVLDAGLKVTRRVPHSYRVSYYELDHKPGIDATVYTGNTDLRFINDTPAHILIRSINEPEKRHLRYEIYGTSDGRQAEIINHKTWGWQPPLPPEYIEDPSLPPGVKKQIDWAAAGIKAKFTNVIKDKNGNIIRQDTYTSNYKPWSAKYLVGPGTPIN